jgi:oxygen-dependent protoporphyrinogen oxidase
MTDVVVIGGGISGLSAAWDLKSRGHSVTVLERQTRTGGNAISERRNGFLIEHGPSTINAAVNEVGTLSGSLGLDPAIVPLSDDVKRRYLVKGGTLSGVSARPLSFLTSSYLSPAARLRLLAEVLVPRGKIDTDETVEAWCSRRFGPEFARLVMDPLVGGLYAGRADELSFQSVFPRLLDLERKYGSITRAVLTQRLRGGAMPGKRLYSWTSGIGSLPATLSAALADDIHTGVTVRRIRRSGRGYEIETANHGRKLTRSILIATQPHVATTFLENIAPVGAEAIASIDAPALAVVFMGFRRQAVDHPLDGLGYLSPRREDSVLTGAQFPSSMFARRAPDGHVSITGYLGGARCPEVGQMNRRQLLDLAQQEFTRLLGVRGQPEISNVRCWSRGIPQYRTGHAGTVESIRNIARESPGIFVTGNYLDGPSVGACVVNAQKSASDVSGYLQASLNRRQRPSSENRQGFYSRG